VRIPIPKCIECRLQLYVLCDLCVRFLRLGLWLAIL
jgi:hypothetical protein